MKTRVHHTVTQTNILHTLILYISLLIAIIITIFVYDRNRDDCTAHTSQPGVCRLVSDCPQIENAIRQGIRNHEVCGFQELLQTVCCPKNVSSTARNRMQSTRISARKCEEYKEFAYNKIFIGTIFGVPPVEKRVSNCAFTTVPLIIGGTDASKREFPHMALIGFNEAGTTKWDCGGTLISNQFVLSAGHCVNPPRQGPARYVRLGEYDKERTDDGTAIDFNIIKSIPHPEYKYPIKYNDIALFMLDRKVEFNEAIRPACLHDRFAIPTKKAIATGWGKVKYEGGTGTNVLQKVVLEIFSQSECSSTYEAGVSRRFTSGVLEESQVCYGSHDEMRDTCQGDSGGPLQIYHDNFQCTYTIVGVTSFGKACALVGMPGVYTRVYAYLNWIEGIVWPNE